MTPAIRSGVPAGPVDDGAAVEAGGEDTDADDVGVPLAAGAGLWWEVATLATAALAPAMTITPSAASAGAQRRPPKAGGLRGFPPKAGGLRGFPPKAPLAKENPRRG